MAETELQERIVSTYNSLRMGMSIIAVATPVAVVVWGLLFGVSWQDSISAYYFAPDGSAHAYSPYPVRVLFGGVLYAIGSFLYLYKGFSWREDWALNIAGVSAVAVAMCPMYAETGYIPSSNILHFSFAGLLFLCMAYTAVFCHDETLRWLKDEKARVRYRRAYQAIGFFMILFPAIGFALALIFDAEQRHTYWIELAGIWTFAAYWIAKSIELRQSQAEMKVVTGQSPPPTTSR